MQVALFVFKGKTPVILSMFLLDIRLMLHIQVGAGSGTVYLKSETKYEVVMSVLSRSNLHGHIAAC